MIAIEATRLPGMVEMQWGRRNDPCPLNIT